MQTETNTLENSMIVSYIVKIRLPSDSEIPLWGNYLSEMKIYVHTKASMSIFIVALFFIHLKLETTGMSLNLWLNKHTEAHAHTGLRRLGNSLAVQWLGLCMSTAGGIHMLHRRLKIPPAATRTQCSQITIHIYSTGYMI